MEEKQPGCFILKIFCCVIWINKVFSSVKSRNGDGISFLFNFLLFSIGVATTDLYGQCTLKHSGTSAAAPEAAGVFALVLEAKYEINKIQIYLIFFGILKSTINLAWCSTFNSFNSQTESTFWPFKTTFMAY